MNLPKLSVLRPTISKFFSRAYKTKYNPVECDASTRPTITVTIVGANSPVGQTISLLLKQCSLIDELRLFDFAEGLCGTALDLSHIDTNVVVKSYAGLDMLKPAILNSNVVAICGGDAMKPDHPEYELFLGNADYVRNIALHTAEFNPKCILCIATPPIAAMVPLVSEEYKKAGVYDARNILGVTTLGVMRGNSIVAEYGNEDPNSVMCPVVGAMGSTTIVPVVSQTEIGVDLPSPVADVLRSKIATAETHVLTKKYVENTGSCTASPAYATSRFITSVIRGILTMFDGVECAFVRQTGPVGSYLPYMASLVKLGKYGVETLHMPNLDNSECMQLRRAADIIQQQIFWGESYITGAEMKRKHRCKRVAPPCPVVTVEACTKIGDVEIDSTPPQRSKRTSGGV